MKKMLLLLLVLALMCTAGAAVAHPPLGSILSYSRDEGILKVDAPHSVSDVKKHYINLFTVSVNGEAARITARAGLAGRRKDLHGNVPGG